MADYGVMVTVRWVNGCMVDIHLAVRCLSSLELLQGLNVQVRNQVLLTFSARRPGKRLTL